MKKTRERGTPSDTGARCGLDKINICHHLPPHCPSRILYALYKLNEDAAGFVWTNTSNSSFSWDVLIKMCRRSSMVAESHGEDKSDDFDDEENLIILNNRINDLPEETPFGSTIGHIASCFHKWRSENEAAEVESETSSEDFRLLLEQNLVKWTNFGSNSSWRTFVSHLA